MKESSLSGLAITSSWALLLVVLREVSVVLLVVHVCSDCSSLAPNPSLRAFF